MDSEANLTSFVLRFVFDQPPEVVESASAPAVQPWHGVIRHVQTNQERHFTRWAEAEAFIAQYIELNVTSDESHGRLRTNS